MTGFRQTFSIVTRALIVDPTADDDAALAADLADPGLDWSHLLRLADQEHVTGAFAVALRRRKLFDGLPKPAQKALRRRLFMGQEFNERIKSEAEEVVGLLNSVGCTPMILKGGLFLFETAADGLGGRVLRDLDMVVPHTDLDACVDVMQQAGYEPEDAEERWTYHYCPLHHPNRMVPVELHIQAGEQRHFINAEHAWAHAVPVDAEGLKMVALSPEHRVMHNIFNSEIQDTGFLLGEVCLRQLIDLAAICVRYDAVLDWQAIDAHLQAHGMGRAFRARLLLVRELLGAPVPEDLSSNTLSGRFHLKHCMIQQNSPRLTYMTRWIAGITAPLKPHHLDLTYGCGTRGLSLQAHRVKHIFRVMRQHRGGFRESLAKYGQSMQ